jgi:hypothetical protein
MYFLSLNTQNIWKEQVSKTLGFQNNKKDIIKSRNYNISSFDMLQNSLEDFISEQKNISITT